MTEAFERAVSTNPLGFERSEPTPCNVLDQIRSTTGCARVVVTKIKKDPKTGKIIKDPKTGKIEKEVKNIGRIHYSFFGGWGQKWVANTADIPTGAQDVALSCTAQGELPVMVYANYRAYANVLQADLESLVQTDIGLYEILIEGQRKVYFDVDGKDETAKKGQNKAQKLGDEDKTAKKPINKAQKLRDDYEKVKEIILSYFPGARLQISGSDVPLKYSLHIVLSNYYAESVAETEVLKHFAQKFKEEYGFDEGVYTKNRYMKAINQSKRERDETGRLKPPRTQSYIEGDPDIKKHFIMAFFDNDSVNISELERLQEEFINTRAVGGSNGACGSVLDIPQFDMTCAENFDFHTATPIEKLWQIPPERLVHDVTWKIMLCCRSIGAGFEDFWEWARRYKDDPERHQKYTSAWNSPKEYAVSENFLDTVLLRFYPRIKEHQAVKRMRAQFELGEVRNNGKEWLEGKDIDKEKTTTFIVAVMGAGKTVSSINFAGDFKSKRILWITCRITLTHNTLEKLANAGLYPKSYLDLTKKQRHSEDPFGGEKDVACSITSLNLLKGRHDFDLVVVDEIETVLGTFLGGKAIHREKLHLNWIEFVRVLKAAKKILALDGIATKTSVEFLKGVRGDSIELLTNTPNPDRAPFCFFEYEKRVDWLAGMAESLRENKKLYIFVPYKDKRGVEELGDSLQVQFGLEEGAVLRYHALRKEEKRALCDPDAVWNDHKVRIVISNATNGVGVDHSTPDVFDEIWCMYSNFLPAREFYQAIRRIRNPRSKTLHLFCEKTRTKPKELKDSRVLHPVDDPVWDTLSRNLEIEEKADLQSSSHDPQCAREMFCLFAAKCALLIYPGPSVRMSDKVREKTAKLFAGEGSVFKFESIGGLEGSEFTEALARINSNTDTMDDALQVEKAYFLQLFREAGGPAAAELWDVREFVKKAHEVGSDPNHTIAKILSQNSIAFGEEFGELMKCDSVPVDELVKILPRSNHPLRNYTVDLTAKVINSYFGMECYIRTQKRKEGRFVYKTTKAYLKNSELCKKALRAFM